MAEYISREEVFQVVHGIARGIADRDTEALKAKDMKAFYMAKGAKKILDSVDTDLCYIPAADVQPVKHGHWIPQGDDMWLCSNCKENIIYSEHESDRTEKQRYCCRCGARMDGDAE